MSTGIIIYMYIGKIGCDLCTLVKKLVILVDKYFKVSVTFITPLLRGHLALAACFSHSLE